MPLKNKVILLFLFACIFICFRYSRAEEMLVTKTLTLNDCLHIALEHNPRLAVYKSKVRQMKQRFLGESLDDYQTKLWFKQSVYTGGRISAVQEESFHSLNAANKMYKETENEVIFSVKTAYYRMVFAADAVDIKKDLHERMQSFLLTAQELNRRTMLPREETLLHIKAQLSNARQEYITAEKNKVIAQKLLVFAMGIDEGGGVDITGLQTIQEKPDEYAAVPATVPQFDSNPALLRLDEEIKRAESLARVIKSMRYPQVSMLVSYGYEWSRLPPEQDDWTAGISLDMPLWDWHKSKMRTEQAYAYIDEIKNSRSLIKKQLSYELASAYLNYKSGIERIEIADEGLKFAQGSLELFEKRYKDATATSAELLDAEQSYLQARLNYSQAILDMRLAKAEMERITGK